MKCKQEGKVVRCECGGQVAVSGTVHVLADLSVGFKDGRTNVLTSYDKRACGYSGFCLKCRKAGQFLF